MTVWKVLRIRNVWVLGATSLFNDAASDMVMPLLPLFVATTLGGGAAAVGAIEGIADFVASVLKWQVGRWSDRLGVTRPFVVSGYAIAASVRPFLAIAASPWHVLAVRVVDRVGKGVRSGPRDTLLANSVDEPVRGTAFGLHRAMDHTGATLGPLLALCVLWASPGNLRLVFAIAVVPGIVAALLAIATEPGANAPPRRVPTSKAPPAPPLPRTFWPLLGVVGLITLSTASDAFLLLEAGISNNTPMAALPVLWIALHLVRIGASGTGGWWSDRFGPKSLIALAVSVRVVCFAGLAYVHNPWLDAAIVAAYGLASVGEGAERKWVASVVPANLRGSAFGAYYAIVGICALPASLGFGLVWERFGSEAAFGGWASLGIVAIVALWALRTDTPAPGR